MNKHIEEIMKCMNSFAYFCETYVKIIHPKKGLIPFTLLPYQQRLIEHYENNRFTSVVKFRQGGFTTTTILYMMWKCIFQLDQRVLMLSKTIAEANYCSEIIDLALFHLPEWMRPNVEKRNHERYFPETNSQIYSYIPEACKSKRYDFLIVDEAAFIKDMEYHWKCLYPILSCGGKCIILSTPNGIGNWFHDIVYDSRNKKNDFTVFETNYREHPDYQNQDWMDEMRKNLGEKAFLQEVEGTFVTENCSISKETAERLLNSI